MQRQQEEEEEEQQEAAGRRHGGARSPAEQSAAARPPRHTAGLPAAAGRGGRRSHVEGALSHGAWSRAERAMSCARPQPRTASSQPFWTPPPLAVPVCRVGVLAAGGAPQRAGDGTVRVPQKADLGQAAAQFLG